MARPQPLRIALASTTSLPGRVKDNLAQISTFAHQAGRDKAALLLTPELSACGYGSYPEVLKTAETAGAGPICDYLARTARKTGVTLTAGFVEKMEEKRFLSHYIIQPDGTFFVQRKHRVTHGERPLDSCVPLSADINESTPGQPKRKELTLFEIEGVKSALTICADSGIVGLTEFFKKNKVKLWLLPTGSGGKRQDRFTSSQLNSPSGRGKYVKILESLFFPPPSLIETCLKDDINLVAVNLCGFDGKKHYHASHGFIITSLGEISALIPGQPVLDRQDAAYACGEITV